MELRPALTPPKRSKKAVATLAAEVSGLMDAMEEPDAAERVAAFDHRHGTAYTVDDFANFWRSQDADEVARGVIATRARAVAGITRDELVEVVRRIQDAAFLEHQDWYLGVLRANVPHPSVSDLIFWPERGDPTPEQVVDEALVPRGPILL